MCLVTDDPDRLRSFYQHLLERGPDRAHDDYCEFDTPGAALSIYSRSKLEPYAPGATTPGTNRAVMIELEVEDVDAEYARLRHLAIEWVKRPSTQPWGNRSIYLRDPDGNLVNLYARVPSEKEATRA